MKSSWRIAPAYAYSRVVPLAAAPDRYRGVMPETYDRLAALPISVEGYELEDRDRVYSPEFTRPSTIIHIRGAGEEGLGEDVVYDVLDHIAMRDAGPVHDLTGPGTLGELCELLGDLDLFEGAPPVREPSRHYRRWAFESAALDLALRQNGLSFAEAVGREARPVTFVNSTRLSRGDAPSSAEPIRRRLANYPDLRFKLDPENDWTPELIAELSGDRRGRHPRPQGPLPRDAGGRRDRPRALRRGRRRVA